MRVRGEWETAGSVGSWRKTQRGQRSERGNETKRWKKGVKPANGKSKVEVEEPEPVNHRQCGLK